MNALYTQKLLVSGP